MQVELDQTLEILARTPQTLREMLAGLSESWVRTDEGPDTWSAFDIVGHLIHGEETDWIPRVEIILQHGESRRFTPFDRFAQFDKSRGKTLAELLGTFAALRKRNLRTLAQLDLRRDQLELRGVHPELGTVTLGQLLATWAAHDLGHIAQIARVMAKRYASDVGPWRAFMPIFDR